MSWWRGGRSGKRIARPGYCLGDHVGYGVFPNQVIEFVRSRNIPPLIGNYDEGVEFDVDAATQAIRSSHVPDIVAKRLESDHLVAA